MQHDIFGAGLYVSVWLLLCYLTCRLCTPGRGGPRRRF